MADVSVVVPVYNSELYLARCLDSLVYQSLNDLEIVLVDDGSTDISPAIMRDYARRYPGRVVVYTKQNGGQGTARNLGIQKARGAYVGFVDSDDYVEPDMFKTMYEKARQDGSDYVECLYRCLEESPEGGREVPMRGRIRTYSGPRDMFIDPQVSPWNKLYRREILLQQGLCFPEGLIYEDTAFFIKTIPFLKKTSFINQRFVNYMLRGGSTMAAHKNRRVGNIFPVLEDVLGFYKARGLMEAYRPELEYFCVKILLCSSLGRVGRIPDSVVFDELLDGTFGWIARHFPAYRQNPYFKGGKTGVYVRLVKRWNAAFFARVLAKAMKG